MQQAGQMGPAQTGMPPQAEEALNDSRSPDRNEFFKQGPSVYTRIALERPGHYPGKVRQAWQIGKDWKLRKALQTGTDSTGTEDLYSPGKATLMWIRKDSVERAESEAMDKHVNAQGSADRSHTHSHSKVL